MPVPTSLATNSAAALSGGNNRATARSLNVCPYRANFCPSSPSPGSWFYRGDRYCDAGGNHKGYTARIEFDERDNIFVGRVLGLRAMISFHGETVAELRTAFEPAIEDFLLDCTEQGVKPEKSASGKLMLRVPSEVHGAALVAAQASGKSLNQWATEVLQTAAHV